MKIAINPTHKNKMPSLSPSAMRNWWRIFNAQFVNLDLPVQHLPEQVERGYAYTAQHSGYRKADNFICAQHVGLDYDTGDERSSFRYLLSDEFIRNNAYFLHSTASHTNEKPRSRVIFVLDRPIYDVTKYALLTEAFAETYKTNGHADPSCKDPVRLFFGAEGCNIMILGNTLSLTTAAKIVLPYKEQKEKQYSEKQTNGRIVVTGSNYDWLLSRMVNKVAAAPDGTKWSTLGKVAREAGGYIGAGYFTYDEVFNALYQAIANRPSTRDMNVAEQRLTWGLDIGQNEPLYLQEDSDPVLARLFN
jgi:hypothetical protein